MVRSRQWFLLLILAMVVASCGCALFQKRWPAAPVVASPPPPPPPVPQFSVVWDKQDLNAMPLNPQWAEQRDANQLPPIPRDENQNVCVRRPDLKGQCTAEETATDDQPPNLFWRAVCSLVLESKIHGHVDWMPATYYGAINWIHVNWADSDYNLRLFPYDGNTPVQNGLTFNNNNLNGTQYIELEFDSAETSGRFGTSTWKAFDDAANSLDPDDMKRWLDPQHHENSPFAVVTGLFNLDCEHDCRSELHPLYSLAVETNPATDDNTWAILVRNWGNGGSCSGFNQQLELPGNQFQLLLPNSSGKPTVLWDKTEFAVSNPSIPFPTMSYVAGTGFVLTFTLPDPTERALVELAIHLQWPKAKPAPPRMKLPLPAIAAEAMAQPPGNEEDAESYVHALFQQVGGRSQVVAGAKLELLAMTARSKLATPAKPAKVRQFRSPKAQPAKPGQTFPSRVKSVPDTEKQKRDTALFRSLCAAYRAKGQKLPTDKVPQLAALCESPEMQ